MKTGFYLKTAIMAGCLLVSTVIPGFSFVTPEHYEKLQQEARIKEKNDKAPPEVPGKIQVHPPAGTTSPPAGSIKK